MKMKRIISAALALFIAVPAIFAGTVSGVVNSAKGGVPGVVVTDGYSFAKTDANGKYSLKLNGAARFVHIVTPGDYNPPYTQGTPEFYLEVDKGTKSYDFYLNKVEGNPQKYVLVAIADPQTQTDRHFERFRTESLPDIAKTAQEFKAKGYNVKGICLGDIAWDTLSFMPRYKKEMAKIGFPFYPVIGNHDHDLNVSDDIESAHMYNRYFGPEYYAFNAGNQYYIVLDNIVYNGKKDYYAEVSKVQMKWLEGYVKYLPAGAEVYIAMHSPFNNIVMKDEMRNGSGLLNLFKGFRVTFLTGHTHINSGFEVREGVREYNVASVGGAWWTADFSKDGTPCGYQVLKFDGKFTDSYYKSTGKEPGYQFELYPMGTFAKKSNSIVAKIWDWNPSWKVEWFEDGKYMGSMEQFDAKDPDYQRYLEVRRKEGKKEVGEYKRPLTSFFYFAATPGVFSKEAEVVVTDQFGNKYSGKIALNDVDIQAHRGGIGLMPENTIPAMINAIKLGVNTLEMDLNISKDRKVVVSHDPYMNYKFVTKPDGTFISQEETKEYKLYNMTYDSIRKFDTGMKPHPDFKGQKKLRTYKPLISELIDSVENFVKKKGYSPMRYNIEIKSSVTNDNLFSPVYNEFADLAIEVLLSKNLGDRLVVQCFDVRTLNYLHNKYSGVRLSYLVDKNAGKFEDFMSQINFTPEYLSPHYSLVDEELVSKCRALGIKIVPWTVDKPEDIQRILGLKVDAIISNYPDRVIDLVRKY